MTSTIYTILYRGTPAQLVGILWDRDKGDTGLAVIRLKSEGRYLRTVHPSELSPLTTRNLRPAAQPLVCGACGRDEKVCIANPCVTMAAPLEV
jgi:hypothetical protein